VFDQPLVFLDVETTGAHPVYDRITEIGLVSVDPGGAREDFSTLLNPGVSIPPAIQSLTGITNDMVALAPRFEELAAMLYGRLEGRVLIAHNARFDYGFLRNEFRRAGVRYASQVLCTVKLSRTLHPREARHNLDALMARYGIACEQRHRALGDARVLWQLAGLWARTFGPDAIAAAARLLLRAPTVPAGLPEGALEGIPEGPGVYLFYGRNDAALYVGKSVNLRSRVLSHFSGDHRDGRDMEIAREVRRVDWIETPGELGALIEEARLVKELAPVYNRRLRRSVELCSWHWRAQAPADPPRLKMRPWPFGGRVGIREPGGTADSLIVLDRWCYLGTARSDTALQELLERSPRPVFDLDTYRILTRYLLGSAHRRCTVVPLPA